jgi:hypothetical protein
LTSSALELVDCSGGPPIGVVRSLLGAFSLRSSRRLLVLSIPLALTRQTLGQASVGPLPRTNVEALRSVFDSLEEKILGAAQAMPAEKYSFAEAGEFADASTFGERLKHIAADLYFDAETILEEGGVADIGSGEAESPTVLTKPQIITYLRRAFIYMHRAATTIDDANELVLGPSGAPFGPPRSARLRIAIANIGRLNDHYGKLVEYLRMNGITPPARLTRQGLPPYVVRSLLEGPERSSRGATADTLLDRRRSR